MIWLLLLIIIICIAIAFKINASKSELQKSANELIDNLFNKQRWLYLTMNETKLMSNKLLDKVDNLIRYMDYKPDIFWNEMPTSKVLIIMDDEHKGPIGFLKTLRTDTCQIILERVMKKASFVDDLRDTIYISSVFIHPEHRGNGYGEKMLNLIVKLIKNDNAAKKICRIILEVKKFNKPAYKLYEKIGFKIIGKDKEAYLMMLEI